MAKRPPSIEVSSDSIKGELTEIKERVAALENVAGLVNRVAIEAHVKDALSTQQRRDIMKECETPRTREYLQHELEYASAPALDHHLRPLREESLIHVKFDEDGKQTFEWSNLVRRLPKAKLRKILDGK